MKARTDQVGRDFPRDVGRRSGRSLAPWLAAVFVVAAVLTGVLINSARRGGAPPPQPGKASSTGAAATAPSAGLAPLVLELPQPRYIGTPVNLKSPNLEKPRTGPRPDLRVPAEARNVALHKPVTASDTSPTLGELSQVTDGDKEGVEGSYVEIGAGRQYFQVDLQRPHRVDAIVVWHFHAQARIYRDVVVQVSGDAAFGQDVHTLYNNDHDGTLGMGLGRDKEYIDGHEGLLIDAGGVTARYVRLWGNGNTENDLNHCTEIEVYGAPQGAP